MSQEQKHDGHASHDPNQKCGHKVPVKSKFRLFPPGYFANNDWAILLFGFAILFAGVIIPTSYKAKVICAWLLLACAAVLLIHGIVNRNVGTDEEIDERFRQSTDETLQRLGAKIDDLTPRLDKAEQEIKKQGPRRLTPSQRDTIVNATAQFPGQKVMVFYKWGDAEASSYADLLIEALKQAGWDFWKGAHSQPQMYPSDFRNVSFYISLDDANSPPMAMRSLLTVLLHLGIIDEKAPIRADKALPKGAIVLRVSSKDSAA